MLRLLLWKFTLRVVLVLVLLSALAAIVHRAFHFLRGRRDRDAGIPCVQCKRVAFPVEGTTVRYRCWFCGCRFAGPEHF
jgi:hypothetical protein